MEKKSILIQSDEVTKNIMSELQDDMINSLSKVSKNMSEEIIEKFKPIEKKINDLKTSFQEFQEEDFEEKIEDINNSVLKITKSIESTIEAAIGNIIKEQNKVLFDSLEERLAILGLKVVKDAANNKELILNKIDNISVDKLEEKVELLEKSIDEKVGLIEKSIEEKTEALERSVEDNLDNSKNSILGKISNISDKMEDKDVVIGLINDLEGRLNKKIDKIEEEVEWGNKSFLTRIFGKRR